MTYFEKIKELVEKNDKIAIGKLFCNLYDNSSIYEENPCNFCPASNLCWINHNGFVELMDHSYNQ